MTISSGSGNWFQIDNLTQDWLIPVALGPTHNVAIGIGDLCYDNGSSTDVALPAGQQASQGSESADQSLFTSVFIGCATEGCLSTETNTTRRVTVLTQGVKKFNCPSQAWNKGDLVGIYSDGANPPDPQQVDAAADAAHAIGVVVKGTLGVSVTTVTVAFVARNYTGQKALGTTLGALTVSSLSSSAATFPINGKTAAQGGSVTMTGGTSSTSGNAGGVAAIVGGTPGATGIGGAVTITGAVGGATSGAGGAVTMTGGAGTNGNAAGGAAALIGGAGQGSAAGGAITITSGAAGVTGVAGAVNISVGAATAGAGSNMTLTGGNGAGGTAAGGNVNLVAGTAVSTGVPGEVQVNGHSDLIPIQVALTATDASRAVFIATRACRFKAVSYMHTTGSTSGTLQIEKLTGTTAAGSGTVLLTGTMDLSATTVANTVITGTPIATVASLTLAAGDRLSVKIAGTMTNLVGAIATLMVAPA